MASLCCWRKRAPSEEIEENLRESKMSLRAAHTNRLPSLGSAFKLTVFSSLPLSFQALPPRPWPSPIDVLLPFSWKTGTPSPLLRHQSCSHLGWRPSFSLSLHGVDQVSVRCIKRSNIDRIFQLSRFGPLREYDYTASPSKQGQGLVELKIGFDVTTCNICMYILTFIVTVWWLRIKILRHSFHRRRSARLPPPPWPTQGKTTHARSCLSLKAQ